MQIFLSSNLDNLYVGGLIGSALSSDSKISYCYAVGNISCSASTYIRTSGIGGLIGSNTAIVRNCYATGDISISISDSSSTTNKNITVGGLIGKLQGTASKCYRGDEQNISVVNQNGSTTTTGYGEIMDIADIWQVISDNWDSEIWEFYNDKNPTLKISNI